MKGGELAAGPFRDFVHTFVSSLDKTKTSTRDPARNQPQSVLHARQRGTSDMRIASFLQPVPGLPSTLCLSSMSNLRTHDDKWK